MSSIRSFVFESNNTSSSKIKFASDGYACNVMKIVGRRAEQPSQFADLTLKLIDKSYK